jgi:hypothetical protein
VDDEFRGSGVDVECPTCHATMAFDPVEPTRTEEGT